MNLVHNVRCVLLPVNDAHFLGQFRIIGHLALILRNGLQCACFQGMNGLQQQLCPHVRKPLRQLSAAFLRQNVHTPLQQHRPGVNAPIHQHGGNAGLLISLQNPPRNGGTSPVFGQEGRMHVNVAKGRNVQQLLRQNLPEGRRHAQVRCQSLQLFHAFLANPLGLIDRNPPAKGFLLHRRRG